MNRVHYAGPLTWRWGKHGVGSCVGPSPVCNGRGTNQTRVRADVTCKRCLAILLRADQWEREHRCPDCDQPMLPPCAKKNPNHANGCPWVRS